jgi:hypothetical protein
MRNVRATLISLLLVCLCLRIAWWAIGPIVVALVPYLVIGFVLISILSIAVFRTTRL